MRVAVAVGAVLATSLSIAHADLASDEREFGEHMYKMLRSLHDQTCDCKTDGNCRLKVSRQELKTQQSRLSDSIDTIVPRLWPDLAKKLSKLPVDEARRYGARLGQEHLDTRPRDEILLWARMLSTCWTVSAPSDDGKRATSDEPHDGSLSSRETIMDMRNGKLDEASGIAVFLDSCEETANGNPSAPAFCGCISDYLRLSKPSLVRAFDEAGRDGDASAVLKLPGVQACTKWVSAGTRGRSPYFKRGMKTSQEVRAAFNRCRTNMTGGKHPKTGIGFCNRLVATTP